MLDKPGDLAGILMSLEDHDVLFIDEIHRLHPVVEEYLYSAMEDFRIDILLDKGRSAKSVQLTISPFTLIGATTRSGSLTAPLRARFGINCHLEYYDHNILKGIVKRSAGLLKIGIDDEAALEIALRSRGTPRVANSLLRRVRDFAMVRGSSRIDLPIARHALEALNIDRYGLDEIDNRILLTIIDKFKGTGRSDNNSDSNRRRCRHHRGSIRALPDQRGIPQAHPARTRSHGTRLPPPRQNPGPLQSTLFD